MNRYFQANCNIPVSRISTPLAGGIPARANTCCEWRSANRGSGTPITAYREIPRIGTQDRYEYELLTRKLSLEIH